MITDTRYIRRLATNDDALEVLGGKGRSLARMINAGFAVPDGFHLTTAAYRRYVEDNNLQAKIIEMARPEVINGAVSFERASASVQQLFDGPDLSEDTISELREAYAGLGSDAPAVAVRSSATAEDLPGLSFAGQQETYLNVRGADALIEAVRNCWASLWTAQAISYRHQMGIESDGTDQGGVAMAVVVQIMVPAEVAGILFTANPATGERSEMIINASFGLGEAVVGGQVTPDSYVLDRESHAAKETIIGPKEQKVVADGEQGTRLQEVARNERDQSSLTDADLSELASVAVKVEQHFDGLPQDIEWAITGGKLWLLQSRPITNLPPQPIEESWIPRAPAKIMVRRQIVENMPEPLCPLFEELYLTEGLQLEFAGGHWDTEEWRERMEGPLYMTVNGIAYQRMDWKDIPIPGITEEPERPEPTVEEKRAQQAQMKKTKAAALVTAEHDMGLFTASLSPADLGGFNDMAEQHESGNLGYELTMPNVADSRIIFHGTIERSDQQIRDWHERAMPGLVATTDEWRDVDSVTASDDQLLTGIRALGHAEGRYWSGRNGGKIFGVIKSSDESLQQFLAENTPGHRFTSGQFLSGFKSRIMQANEDLWEISKLVQADGSLCELVLVTPATRLMDALKRHPNSSAVLQCLDKYMDTYGHQGYSLDFVEPPPIEEPSPVFITLKTMVADRAYNPHDHETEATRKREAAFAEIEKVLHGLQYWQFRYRVWFAGRYYPYREEIFYFLGIAWPTLRRFTAELGRRMVDAGTFALADDTYYLTMAELRECAEARSDGRAIAKYRQIAADRRELREAQKRLRAPGTIPEEVSGNPYLKESHTRNDPASDTLNGVGVSPGTVTGSVSLINSAAEFDQMKPGTILVCPMTNPAWTQLFAHATGLVTDIGGILGHGSIVAREYGIPAVVGTGNMTERVQSGQLITVDGDVGVVTILEDTQ